MTKSTALGGFGIDAVMARSRGRCYMPGTLVKGRLREAWQELSGAAPSDCQWPLDEWLGKEKGNRNRSDAGFEPQRSRIQFDDLQDAAARPSETRYRIRIDELRGSVEKGALMVVEAPYASGEPVQFTGPVWFIADSEAELTQMRRAVLLGLRWVTSFGGERSVGFGGLRDVALGPATNTAIAETTPVSDLQFEIELEFDRPFAAATRLLGQNLFESDDVIPGAAVRGVIGELLQKGLNASFKELAENLALVRVTHAFPTQSDGKRASKRPQSLVSDGTRLWDVALLENQPAELSEPLAFATDWKAKDFAALPKEMDWPELERELRVRTAIQGETRRAADNQLFAVRMIVPNGHRWIASVDLSRIADAVTRKKVARQLAGVFQAGLPGVGKTKAFARVRPRAATGGGVRLRRDGKYVICLQTPALLLCPNAEETENWHSTEGLKNAYRKIWSDLSDGTLLLSNFFQTTSLAGGDYLHHTFRGGQPYKPYLLTEAGSVFVFDAVDVAKATVCVSDWLAHGLPLPVACRAFYVKPGVADVDLWKHCPYLPENGYGELAVNLEIHEELAWEGKHVQA